MTALDVDEHDVELTDHTTRLVDRRGTDDREPLVLVHALGLDRRMWSQVIDLLPTDRRVIAYDVRGHGRAADAPPAANLHDHARDLAALLDRLGIESARIAGLSMGGSIAQTFAIDYPHRVTGLDLVATGSDPVDVYLARADSAEADGMNAQIVPTLTRWFTLDALAENAWPVRYARDLVARASVADWAASWRALYTIDVRPQLGRITVPTRVIAGELDAASPPQAMRAIAVDIPNAEFSVVPDVAHMISLQKPHELAAILSV
jgi:3-oxoadipate enol-lactonase